MKNKLKSLLSTIAITCAVGVPLSLTTAHELPLQAALTAPSSYDLNYVYDGVSEGTFVLGTSSLGSLIPIYTRTSDSTHFNYSTTINNSQFSILPLGLQITMTFNRSNTDWVSSSGGYIPFDTKIGSDNTVGTIFSKVVISINNQTNKDYRFYLDISSSSASRSYNFYINGLNYFGSTLERLFIDNNVVASLPLFANSTFELNAYSTGASSYLDAWFLKDLGINASYTAGYEVGEDDGYQDGLANNPNILINAAESLIGMFVNFTFILFSLELFGVSILSIVGVLFGIIAIVWILKTIRGG
jgi:hypothetical protein